MSTSTPTAVLGPTQPPAPAPAVAAQAKLSGRLMSLDVFRGMTIAGMLLVNNPGTWSAIYPPLKHAAWHGWTPTDLIFPFFLFIAGVAMTFSFGKLRDQGAPRGQVMGKAAKRSLKLILLGLILQSYPWWSYDYSTLRFPGVLQRIGVVLLAVTPVVLWLRPKAQAAVAAALLLGYWALLSWVPVPGIGAGVWEPSKDLGAYLDRLIFTTDHLWSSSKTWDPEGLLSTLPAIGTGLLGVLTGEWIRRKDLDRRDLLLGLFLAGGVLMVLGLMWHWVFPINKALWTSSYVLFTAGMGMQALATTYWVVDVQGYRRWAMPFLVYGVNAIAAFFLSSLVARILVTHKVPGPAGEPITLKGWLFETLFTPVFANPLNASLAYALTYVLFWMGLMALMYKRGIFVKV